MKLFAKGLLLIAIPSAIELALLSAVFSTQQQAMEAARSEEASRQILWQASGLADPLLREAVRARTGIVLGDPSFIDRHAVWVEFSDQVTQLAHAVADSPAQAERVERIRDTAAAWRAQLTVVANAMREGRSVAAAQAAGSALPPEIVAVRGQLAQFIAHEQRLDDARIASSRLTRTRQQSTLIVAIIGSMLVWASAAAVFSRGIGRRLALLRTNAQRLGDGLPLAGPLPGNDEIAALDAVLHQTSARLSDAKREQSALKAQLEARVADLANANEHLRQETQDNEMFIYSVSHDLRSPLVNLQGFSKELQVSCDELRASVDAAGLPAHEQQRMIDVLDGDIGESLRFLRAAVERAAAIIDALLRISRVGRLEYRFQRVDVASVVERVVDGLRDVARARGVQIIAGDLPQAWADADAVGQIFTSLLDNALQHLDPGRPGRIEIGALDPQLEGSSSSTSGASGPPAGGPVRQASPTRTFYVRDNGVGIPADYLPKLFHAFQRLHDDARGLGVGLALVRRIAERLGGRVWAESEEGVGSTFFVALPEQSLLMW